VYDPEIAVMVTLIVSPALNHSSQKLAIPSQPFIALYDVGFWSSVGYHHVMDCPADISIDFPTGVHPFVFLSDVADTRDSTRAIAHCHE
jgi:hypothetical protein